MADNNEVFAGKSFEELLKDIYTNSASKKGELQSIYKKLIDMVQNPGDAVILAPIAKDFMELEIKSDEHLVKLAMIFQKIYSANIQTVEVDYTAGLTDAQKDELLAQAKHDMDKVLEARESEQKLLENKPINIT